MPIPVPAISERIADVMALDPAGPFVEYECRWYRWGDLAHTAEAVSAQIAPGTRVGILLRNRPAQLGLLVGLLRAGANVVTINPDRGVEWVRREVAGLDLPAIAAHPDDVELTSAGAGAALLTTADLGAPIEMTGAPRGRTSVPGVAVEMLTSGTTGPPKRIPLSYDTLARVLAGAKYYESKRNLAPSLRPGVAIINAPLVHLSGLFRVLQCVVDGRSFCLLEKFAVDAWLDAVRRHRPVTVSLVPAALRSVLDADLDPADLASLKSVFSGTAPLDPDDADAFYLKYGVPVLTSYAATEFGGGVAGWTLGDHFKYWTEKRGSAGRAHPGCELRVVDPETGEPVPADAEGQLEVKTRQLGDESDWLRTTDLARLDADGFLWILGRSDQTIIRGGFKVQPETVRAALDRDPRVRDVAVVACPDARLGAVPVAAVELRSSADAVTADELLAGAGSVLARYELPREIRIVDSLPRTPSGKVDLLAVRALFDSPAEA